MSPESRNFFSILQKCLAELAGQRYRSAALPSPRDRPLHHHNMPLCQGTHGAAGDIQGPAADGQTHLLKQALINSRIYNTFQEPPTIQWQTTSCMPGSMNIFKSAKEKRKNKFMTRLQSVLLKLLFKTAFEGLDSIVQADLC